MKIPLYINLATLVLNFLLDPLFIYGWGPVPAFGVTGAAVATVCTQALAFAVGLAVLLRASSCACAASGPISLCCAEP